MFDSRWDSDARDRDAGSRDLGRGRRDGGSDPRDRDRPDPRDVLPGHVDLPRGRDRAHVHHRGHGYPLRATESRTLSRVRTFRVIPANDLRDTFDTSLDPRHGELWHLREAGLVQTARIDRNTTVVTLTREARHLLDSCRWDPKRWSAIGRRSTTAASVRASRSTTPRCIAQTSEDADRHPPRRPRRARLRRLDPTLGDLRLFLERHAAVLRALRA